MVMWQACLSPSSSQLSRSAPSGDACEDGGYAAGWARGGGAEQGGVLDVTSLAYEVSDVYGMQCHLVMCLSMCPPWEDGLLFGGSKLVLLLMRCFAVRGKWALPM